MNKINFRAMFCNVFCYTAIGIAMGYLYINNGVIESITQESIKSFSIVFLYMTVLHILIFIIFMLFSKKYQNKQNVIYSIIYRTVIEYIAISIMLQMFREVKMFIMYPRIFLPMFYVTIIILEIIANIVHKNSKHE